VKIAILGTAPSSVRLAPFNDPQWQIWACSPGTYPILPRCDAFFELHRQEAPVIGRPDQQVPWLSPEYWMWMAKQKLVYMAAPHQDIPNSVRYPFEQMLQKYGYYNFTSSIAWMLALAIEQIEAAKKAGDVGPHSIGMWGVDMAATEEYGYQRSGCQFFVQIAADLDIQIVLPPESDLMTPPALYGIFESSHRGIKMTARMRELQSRKNQIEQSVKQLEAELHFVNGAISDHQYHMSNWMFEGDYKGAEFNQIFAPKVQQAEKSEATDSSPTFSIYAKVEKPKRKYVKRKPKVVVAKPKRKYIRRATLVINEEKGNGVDHSAPVSPYIEPVTEVQTPQ